MLQHVCRLLTSRAAHRPGVAARDVRAHGVRRPRGRRERRRGAGGAAVHAAHGRDACRRRSSCSRARAARAARCRRTPTCAWSQRAGLPHRWPVLLRCRGEAREHARACAARHRYRGDPARARSFHGCHRARNARRDRAALPEAARARDVVRHPRGHRAPARHVRHPRARSARTTSAPAWTTSRAKRGQSRWFCRTSPSNRGLSPVLRYTAACTPRTAPCSAPSSWSPAPRKPRRAHPSRRRTAWSSPPSSSPPRSASTSSSSGGNAVDAAVAVGYALAVVYPGGRQSRRRRLHDRSSSPTAARPSSTSARRRRSRRRPTCISTPPATSSRARARAAISRSACRARSPGSNTRATKYGTHDAREAHRAGDRACRARLHARAGRRRHPRRRRPRTSARIHRARRSSSSDGQP